MKPGRCHTPLADGTRCNHTLTDHTDEHGYFTSCMWCECSGYLMISTITLDPPTHKEMT